VIRVSTGIALAALGMLGAAYGVRVAISQIRYHAVKYGTLSDAPPAVIADACESAYTLYPHSYFLAIQAVEKLWPARRITDQAERDAAFALVGRWCERGLAQNPYHWRLRRARTRLLARESPTAAAEYWETFVAWQFWCPRNLTFLVECYARAGRLAEAAELLPLLEGREGYDRASAALKRAWDAELYGP